ncbi:MAG: P-loop NTPase, partial [Thermoplasmatales archaeon]|nr:P-loop NTPase [Thermoplasmatales archaeon]
MPGGDRTGPAGYGSRTGRGFGRGFWGRVRGFWRRDYYSDPYYEPAPHYRNIYPELNKEEEKSYRIPKMLGLEDKKPGSSETGIAPILALPKLKVMSMGFLIPDKDAPVIWRGPLKMGAIKQLIGDVDWGNLDYLIIDLPPGTGDEPLSIAQLIPDNDGAVIVTTPQDVALVSVRKSINFVKKMNMPVIGIVENMSGFKCPHCGKNIDLFKTGGGLKASKDFNIPFLGKIPIDPQIVETGDSGKTFAIKSENPDTAKSFKKIVENIEEIVNKK